MSKRKADVLLAPHAAGHARDAGVQDQDRRIARLGAIVNAATANTVTRERQRSSPSSAES